MKRSPTRSHAIAFVVLCTVLVGASFASAQSEDRAGTVGLSAIMQSTQNGIAIPIWVSHTFVIEPIVNVTKVSNVGTDLGVGVMFRGILGDGDVLPYLGLRIVGMFYSPETGDSSTDTVVGPTFGGEYIFADAASLRVEVQVNYGKSDTNSLRFGNPGESTLNTATAVIATIYF